jgi:hypothetical protein
MKKRTVIAIILFLPCILIGLIGMLGTYISYPIFILFNPKYELPNDKAAIDIAPITKWFWQCYIWYSYNYLLYNFTHKMQEEMNRDKMHII